MHKRLKLAEALVKVLIGIVLLLNALRQLLQGWAFS